MKWIAALVAVLLVVPVPVLSDNSDVDLAVAWVKARRYVAEGELVTIKARVENHSSSAVPPFSVSFYLDDIDPANVIGQERYDGVNVYRRPSVTWDTTGMTGNHTVIARVDIDDDVGSNNVATAPVTVCGSSRHAERRIQISELYPHPYPGRDNEYVCIHNPTGQAVNVNRWRLTTTPQRRSDEQTRVVLPNIQIAPRDTIRPKRFRMHGCRGRARLCIRRWRRRAGAGRTRMVYPLQRRRGAVPQGQLQPYHRHRRLR